LIYATGYDNSHPFLKVIGSLAVKVFIIISGFVIFFLIDTRKEPYRAYITRRFFRLFPILAVLLTASVFCLILARNSLQQCVAAGFLTPLTVLATIATSAILYYSIEAPFMKFGSKMAKGKAADASAEKLTQVKTDRSS
jgi:peptidoglycan/LPS O-acetylase OafA/YrhL